MESDGGATRKLVGRSMELKGEMIVLSFSRAGMFRLFLLSFSRAGMSFYQPLAIQDLNVFLFQINTLFRLSERTFRLSILLLANIGFCRRTNVVFFSEGVGVLL